MTHHHQVRMIFALMLVLAMTLGAVAEDKKSKKNVTKQQAPVSETNTAAPEMGTAETYRIGAQDTLFIDVWKEAEFSHMVPVRPDGKISLPLIHDVQATGLTPIELADSLAEKLSKYLESPQVTVTVTQMNSQRFYVLGNVGRAGAYPLLPNQTVLQALSSAGGFSEYANSSKIYILRNENGKSEKLPFNYKVVIKGEHNEQNIQLRPGDTIVVP